MIRTLLDQKTKKDNALETHLFCLLLLFVGIQLSAQQNICERLPQARFTFSQIDSLPYLNIESLSFPQAIQNDADLLSESYYVLIESDNGDYKQQWGPYTGPTLDVFSKEFGPLVSDTSNFKFSFKGIEDSTAYCPQKISFSVSPDGPFSKRTDSNDEQLEDWDTVFEHIDNFEFEKAMFETRTKRSFNAEDAALYEFANFEIERAKKEQFEVYFRVLPNPTEDVVFIQNIETKERELMLIVMDLEGSVKMKKQFEVAKYNKVKLNTNRLKSGNFIVAIMNKNKRIIGMKRLDKDANDNFVLSE